MKKITIKYYTEFYGCKDISCCGLSQHNVFEITGDVNNTFKFNDMYIDEDNEYEWKELLKHLGYEVEFIKAKNYDSFYNEEVE